MGSRHTASELATSTSLSGLDLTGYPFLSTCLWMANHLAWIMGQTSDQTAPALFQRHVCTSLFANPASYASARSRSAFTVPAFKSMPLPSAEDVAKFRL